MTAELTADGNAPSPRPGPAPADAARLRHPQSAPAGPAAPAAHASKSPSGTGKLSQHRASPPPYGPQRAASHLRQSAAASSGVRFQGEATGRRPKSGWRVPAGGPRCAGHSRAAAGRDQCPASGTAVKTQHTRPWGCRLETGGLHCAGSVSQMHAGEILIILLAAKTNPTLLGELHVF